jgi:hypothetical protein
VQIAILMDDFEENFPIQPEYLEIFEPAGVRSARTFAVNSYFQLGHATRICALYLQDQAGDRRGRQARWSQLHANGDEQWTARIRAPFLTNG